MPKRRKKNLLLAGFLIRAAVWLLFIYAFNIFQLIILQIFLGAGESLGTPSFEAIFAEHLNEGKHIKQYAYWKLILNGFMGAGVILGGLIAENLGFKYLFFLMSILALISFFGIFLQPKELL